MDTVISDPGQGLMRIFWIATTTSEVEAIQTNGMDTLMFRYAR